MRHGIEGVGEPHIDRDSVRSETEKRYQKAVDAVDALYRLAQSNERNDTLLKETADQVFTGIREFQDRLLSRETLSSTMPVILRLKETLDLYRKRDDFFDAEGNLGVRDVSQAAQMLIEQAFILLHSKETDQAMSATDEDIASAMSRLSATEVTRGPLESTANDLALLAIDFSSLKKVLVEEEHFIKLLPAIISMANLDQEDSRAFIVRRIGFELLADQNNQLVSLLASKNESAKILAKQALKTLIKFGSDDQAIKSLKTIEGQKKSKTSVEQTELDIFQDSEYRSRLVELSFSLAEGGKSDDELSNAAYQYIEDVSGMDFGKLLEHWVRASDTKGKVFWPLSRVAAESFNAMQELESMDKGSVEYLSSTFGIYNFGRYPVELLRAQYRDRDDTSKPYGTVFFPYEDHNGTFYNYRNLLKQLDGQLLDAYRLIIVEGGTKLDITKQLRRLNRRFGQISFGIVGGHGTEKTINFGGWGKRNQLTMTDLLDSRAEKSGQFFADDATVILFSCSTGFKEGIGQKMSEVLKLRVIAPDKPSTPQSINAHVSNSGIKFDVKFSPGTQTQQYESGIGDEEQINYSR